MTVKAQPDGYQSVIPYLIIKNANDAQAFYKKAFNATERGTLNMPDGTIMHGELQIGDSVVMFSEENPDMGMKGPASYGGSGVTICVYVDDVDALFNQAVASGAESLRPVEDQFWGDRAGTLLDPFGYTWTLMTHIEDVDWDEVERRFNQMMSEPQ